LNDVIELKVTRLGRAWRETDDESPDCATLIRDLLDVQWRWRANVRQHTEQGAADMGCDTGPGGDHCAHGIRSTASTMLNEEGAFDGDVMEAQLAHDTEKKAPAAQGGAAPALARATRTRSAASITVRPLGRTHAFNAALV
jgi:hypothetical protein